MFIAIHKKIVFQGSKIISICMVLVSFAFALVSCSKETLPAGTTNFTSKYSDAKATRYDPDDAKLESFAGEVNLESLEGATGITVPTFYVKKSSSDFVAVLRCKKDYRLTSSTGVPFESLDEYSKYDDMKWIWNSAVGDTSQCKYIGTHVKREKIQDIAAESGEYFYLINPCVSKARSTSGFEACSNDLKKTNSITYESLLRSEFISKASELSGLEIEIGGKTENIKMLSEQIMSAQEFCEDEAAKKAAKQSFLRGLASVAGAAIGGVVGNIMGGPMGAVKGASSFMNMARNLVKVEYKLECKEAESYRNDLKVVVDSLEVSIDKVIVIRNQMAEYESAYTRLNDLIEADTNPE